MEEMDGLRRELESARRERAIWKKRDGELGSTGVGQLECARFSYARNKLPMQQALRIG